MLPSGYPMMLLRLNMLCCVVRCALPQRKWVLLAQPLQSVPVIPQDILRAGGTSADTAAVLCAQALCCCHRKSC